MDPVDAFTLVMEKDIGCAPAVVFESLGRGLLFQHCGAQPESMRIDFRTSGEYFLSFGADGDVRGTFLCLAADRHISFTWGPQTVVTLELTPRPGGTHLRLTHTGISTEELLGVFRGGWADGLQGFALEVGRSPAV